ncbi:hypothetical protein [Nevskia ramosa]|uniref:hypothetical protein n=1 Tax=Nevskia ramosa TaxID=64002 RepID=UPI002355D2DB|nr:hypothetical protein [Nevskia ramosa]
MNDLSDLAPEAQANCAKLPHQAYAFIACHAPGDRIVCVRRGERGYFTTTLDDPCLSVERAKAIVQTYNDKLGVTLEQKSAMIAGSLFGWHTPGADPDRYDGERPRVRSRSEA